MELASQGIASDPDGSLGPRNYLREAHVVPGSEIVKARVRSDPRHRQHSTASFSTHRTVLDFRFCAGYGHDDYSLQAVNYLNRAHVSLPSLMPFLQVPNFSLGNVAVLVGNGDYEIDVSLDAGLRATGHAQCISRTKKKSYLCLFGVTFDRELLDAVSNRLSNCTHDTSQLDEIRIGMVNYPFVAICRVCGQLLTCSCFAGNYSIKQDIIRRLPYGNSEPMLEAQAQCLRERAGLCSLCTGHPPRFRYASPLYYSAFLQRYITYQILYARKQHGRDLLQERGLHDQVENELREKFGFPKIGEAWISETTLYKVATLLFAPLEVVHHYRGDELERLELDVWIPALLLGIEYQGEQHYKAIEHWGGELGLEQRRANDRRKKLLCKKLGYSLVEFRYSEDLGEASVRNKLEPHLDRAFPSKSR